MPPVLGPVSPSPMRLKSRAGASGSARSPSQSASTESSSPTQQLLHQHRVVAEAALLEHRHQRGARLRLVRAITTPLPAASPSALITAG